jgi:hypothetical protein
MIERCPVCREVAQKGTWGLISHVCDKHPDYGPLAALRARLGCPFLCPSCHHPIKSALAYLQHLHAKHPEEFARARPALFPGDAPLRVPAALGPGSLRGEAFGCPSDTSVAFAGLAPRRVVVIAHGGAIGAELGRFFRAGQRVFVRPVCFGACPQIALLIVGGRPGLCVVDCLRAPGARLDCARPFFDGRAVVVVAAPRERALLAGGADAPALLPPAPLATMDFVAFCADAAAATPPLAYLLAMRQVAITGWPAPAMALLSVLSFPLLVLSFFEATGVIPADDAPAPGAGPGAAAEAGEAGAEAACAAARDAEREASVGGVLASKCPLCERACAAGNAAVLQHLLTEHPEMRKVAEQLRMPTTEKGTHICIFCKAKFAKYHDLIAHAVLAHLEEAMALATDHTPGLKGWSGTAKEKIETMGGGEFGACDPYLQKWRKICPVDPVIPAGWRQDEVF